MQSTHQQNVLHYCSLARTASSFNEGNGAISLGSHQLIAPQWCSQGAKKTISALVALHIKSLCWLTPLWKMELTSVVLHLSTSSSFLHTILETQWEIIHQTFHCDPSATIAVEMKFFQTQTSLIFQRHWSEKKENICLGSSKRWR